MVNDDYMKEMEELYQKSLQTNKSVAGVICPHTFDTKETRNPCVLCDLCRDILISRDRPKNDPLKEKARNVNAKKRYYSNMIFLANPSEVVLLEYGDKIFNKLIAGQIDELSEWKNFMHPATGRNLYVTKVKVGPEKKDVDYNVEPRMSISKIPDASVLTRLYDLPNVAALIEAGKVKPVYQSKFDFQKTEVRFLPSGDKTRPLWFFQLLMWHYNVTKEEFAAIQRHQYNPITGLYTNVQEVPSNPKVMTPPVEGPTKVLSNDEYLEEWGLDTQGASGAPGEDVPALKDEDTDLFEVDSNAEPICFGGYDKDNQVCTTRCQKETGWAEACKKVYDEKLALRTKAKRLSK